MTMPTPDSHVRLNVRLRTWAHGDIAETRPRWTTAFLRMKARLARMEADRRRTATLGRLGWGLAVLLGTCGLAWAWPQEGLTALLAAPAFLLPPLACLSLLGWSLKNLMETA